MLVKVWKERIEKTHTSTSHFASRSNALEPDPTPNLFPPFAKSLLFWREWAWMVWWARPSGPKPRTRKWSWKSERLEWWPLLSLFECWREKETNTNEDLHDDPRILRLDLTLGPVEGGLGASNGKFSIDPSTTCCEEKNSMSSSWQIGLSNEILRRLVATYRTWQKWLWKATGKVDWWDVWLRCWVKRL